MKKRFTEEQIIGILRQAEADGVVMLVGFNTGGNVWYIKGKRQSLSIGDVRYTDQHCRY